MTALRVIDLCVDLLEACGGVLEVSLLCESLTVVFLVLLGVGVGVNLLRHQRLETFDGDD